MAPSSPRRRILAYWFAAMLAGSTLAAIVPTAEAATTLNSVTIHVKQGGTFVVLPAGHVIKPTDVVKFEVSANADICEDAGNLGLTTTRVTAVVKTGGKLRATDSGTITLSQVGTSTTFVGTSAEITVATSTPGIQGAAEKLDVEVTRACVTANQPEADDPVPGQTSPFAVDTKPPTLGTPSFTFQNASTRVVDAALLPGAPTLAVGSTVTWTATAQDGYSGIVNLTVSPAAFGSGVKANGSSSGTGIATYTDSFTVLPAASDATTTSGAKVPLLDGSANLVISAVDGYGNSVTQNVALTVDNAPPSAPITASVDRLTRLPGATSINLDLVSWTPAASTEIPAAQILVGGTILANVVPDTDVTIAVPNALTATPVVTIRAIDNAGNIDATNTTTAATAPFVTSLTYTAPQSNPTLVPGAGVGQVLAQVGTALSSHELFTVTLQNSAGKYWNGGAADNAASYVDTPHYFHYIQAGGGVPANTPLTLTNFSGKPFRDDIYRFNFSANGTDGDRNSVHAFFKIDSQPPSLEQPALHASTNIVHGSDGNAIGVQVFLNETRAADSGMKNVTIELTNAAQSANVTNLSGNLARYDWTPVTCAADPVCSGQVTFNIGTFSEDITVAFPNLTVGDYYVRVLATDVAGNVRSKVFTDASEVFKVRPRVALLEGPSTPFLHSNGIEALAYAAYEAGSAPSPLSCDAKKVCQVHNVTFYARNLGSSTEVKLGAVNAPTGAQVALTPEYSYYNFSTPSRLPLGSLNAGQVILLRAEAWVTVDGVHYKATTPAVRVQNPEAPNLVLNKPARVASAPDWFLNTTGAIDFNATFDVKSNERVPVVNYTLWRLDGASMCKHSEGIIQETRTGLNPTPKFLFNYSATFTGLTASNMTCTSARPNSEFWLHVEAHDIVGGEDRLMGLQDRYFAVQTQAPDVTVPTAQDDTRIVHNNGRFYTLGAFDLAVEVQHGLANLSSDANFSFLLRRTEVLGSESEVLRPNDGSGFTVTVKNHSAYSPTATRTFLNLTVTLPTAVTDGRRFTLEINATTDATSSPGTSWAIASDIGAIQIEADLEPPAAGVFREATNETGRNVANPLVIKGFAEHHGAGIERVELRLHNLTGGRTFVWNRSNNINGSFVKSEDAPLDSWLSSDPKTVNGNTLQNIFIAGAGPVFEWQLPTAGRTYTRDGVTLSAQPILLHRGSLYQVEIRVTDKLGRVVSDTQTVQFDPEAPKALDKSVAGAKGGLWIVGGHTSVNWHVETADGDPQNVVLTTNASDNFCIKAVYLKARAPLSGTTQSANFTPPAARRCDAFPQGGLPPLGDPDDSTRQWTLKLHDYPHMTDEIGVYHYWVEVEDLAGRFDRVNPANGNNLSLEVKDTKPAEIEDMYFDPVVAQVGGTTDLLVNISENHGMKNVTVELFRETSGRPTYLGKAEAVPRNVAINGSGTYVVDVAAAFGVTLQAGYYALRVTPRDVADTDCVVESDGDVDCDETDEIFLQVLSDAAPDVRIQSPADGSSFVTSTPTFQFRVLDPAIDSTSITLKVSTDGAAPQTVTPTFTELTSAGNRTGFTVKYDANLTGKQTVEVTLEARDRSGLLGRTNATYTVDAIVPTVNASVADATEPLGGRTYVKPTTRVTLEGSDNESGLQRLQYRVNGGEATTYTAPFAPTGSEGRYLLRYGAVDKAGNINESEIELWIDTVGPSVTVSSDGTTGQDVVVSVTDEGSGLDESTLHLRYAYGSAQSFSNATFEKVSGNLYKVTLTGNATTDGLRYYVEARDQLGNAGGFRSVLDPFVIRPANDTGGGNRAPVVTITAPAANTLASGQVELLWNATDADGDAIAITIALREPTGPGDVLVSAGPNTGRFTYNVSNLTAGTYAFIVTASDAITTGQAEVSFRVGNATPPANPVRVVQPPANTTAGSAVTFSVQIDTGGKTLRNATFTVLKDGQRVANGSLIPLASGFRGSYTPTEPGNYAILVGAAFADGTTMQPTQAATFSVKASEESPGLSFPTSLVSLLAAGVVVIALAAYAAFGRWAK